MSMVHKISFSMISFVHETLYGIFRDPFKALLSAGIKEGQSVLEVGCGPGFFTIPAGRMVGDKGEVVSIDVNPVAVAHVKQKAEEENLKNIRVMEANASATGLPAESFDLVFVFGLGHAAGGIDPIWKEMYRLLRPGGMLSIEGRQSPGQGLFQYTGREGRIAGYRKC